MIHPERDLFINGMFTIFLSSWSLHAQMTGRENGLPTMPSSLHHFPRGQESGRGEPSRVGGQSACSKVSCTSHWTVPARERKIPEQIRPLQAVSETKRLPCEP